MAHQVTGDGWGFHVVSDLFWITTPFERQVYHAARSCDRYQCRQGSPYHRELGFNISWIPNCLPKGMLDAGNARHTGCTRQIRDIRQGDRTKTGAFNLTLYQSNGPVADRSSRHQHDDVDGFIF